MTTPDAENSGKPSRHPKAMSLFALTLVGVLWFAFSYNVPTVCAICTPYWTQFGITFVNGEQAQDATNSNYNYWNYCTLLIPATGVYTPASSLTWTTTSQTAQFKDSWSCTYNGKTDLYFPSNCSWASNITAFWKTAPPPPTCTISATPSTISLGGSSTIAASCTPAATSYTWTGAPDSFTSTTASGSVSPTATTTYMVAGSNDGGTGNTASVTVTVNQPPKPACTLTATPSTINLGDSSILATTCTPAATSYTWTNSLFASTLSGGTVSPTATSSYSVAGVNAAGTGSATSATVTLNPLLDVTSRTQVNATALSLSRATNRYSGTITVTNTAGSSITGPLYVFFTLPTGVTLPGVATYGGVPYVAIPIPGGLAPGATSGSTVLSFADPSNARIAYTTTRSAIAF